MIISLLQNYADTTNEEITQTGLHSNELSFARFRLFFNTFVHWRELIRPAVLV